MEWTKGKFLISNDKRRLQPRVVQQFLAQDSYWAQGIPLEKVRRTLRNSHCFGLFADGRQIGFCRVVTDEVRFAWLSDVFVVGEFRGQGLSKWLLEVVFGFFEHLKIRRWMLGTRDAHDLYRRFGFELLEQPERMMERNFRGEWM